MELKTAFVQLDNFFSSFPKVYFPLNLPLKSVRISIFLCKYNWDKYEYSISLVLMHSSLSFLY